MICPLCEMKVDEFDEPDEAVRAVCCHCKIMIAIHELNNDEVCDDHEDQEDREDLEDLEDLGLSDGC